jgi:hypothetical protein
MAYAFLELTPSQFYDLTPREFSLMYEGFKLRERRKAHYVQWLISVHAGKDTPELSTILGFGDSKEGTPKKVSREIQERTLAELMEKMM